MSGEHSWHSTGIYYRGDEGVGSMPPKQRGQHRWIATAAFALSADAAAAAHRGQAGAAHLDAENLLGVYTGCVDCEAPYTEAGPVCPAPAYTGFDRGQGQL